MIVLRRAPFLTRHKALVTRTCMKIWALTTLPVALSYVRLLPNTDSSNTVWPSGYSGTSTAASTSASVVTELFRAEEGRAKQTAGWSEEGY